MSECAPPEGRWRCCAWALVRRGVDGEPIRQALGVSSRLVRVLPRARPPDYAKRAIRGRPGTGARWSPCGWYICACRTGPMVDRSQRGRGAWRRRTSAGVGRPHHRPRSRVVGMPVTARLAAHRQIRHPRRTDLDRPGPDSDLARSPEPAPIAGLGSAGCVALCWRHRTSCSTASDRSSMRQVRHRRSQAPSPSSLAAIRSSARRTTPSSRLAKKIASAACCGSPESPGHQGLDRRQIRVGR